jgi:hypothetical protein
MTASLIAIGTAASSRSRGVFEMMPGVVASLIWFNAYKAQLGNNLRNAPYGLWFPILMLAASCLVATYKGWWLSLPLPLTALVLVIFLARDQLSCKL